MIKSFAVSQIITTFASENQANIVIMAEQNASTAQRDRLFREKAASYPVCFNESCPRHATCLHWMLHDYLPENTLLLKCVNPHHADVAAGKCPLYRDSAPHRMPYGILSVYHDMPARTERSIKNRLISQFSRKRYYEYHNGTRPMTPEVEKYVRGVIRAAGWKEEPHFMGYVEEYLW